MNYSYKLRLLADYLEDHGLDSELDDWQFPSVWLYAEDAEDFSRICRRIGSFEKSGYQGTLEARHSEIVNDQITYSVTTSLHEACEATVVGRKVRQIHLPEDAVWNDVDQKWEVEENVLEWNCPESFLALGGSNE